MPSPHSSSSINPSLGRCAAQEAPGEGEPWRRAVQQLDRIANMKVQVQCSCKCATVQSKARYQKALERGNSILRPNGFCEADKVIFVLFCCKIQKVAIYAQILLKYFMKINVFISIFGKL